MLRARTVGDHVDDTLAIEARREIQQPSSDPGWRWDRSTGGPDCRETNPTEPRFHRSTWPPEAALRYPRRLRWCSPLCNQVVSVLLPVACCWYRKDGRWSSVSDSVDCLTGRGSQLCTSTGVVP